MKIRHIGQLIGGLDIYIRNSITYANENIEFVIIHGKGDNNKPIIRKYNMSLAVIFSKKVFNKPKTLPIIDNIILICMIYL